MTRCKIKLLFLFIVVLLSSLKGIGQSVVVSSYYNVNNEPRDEWTELLVVNDNTDMRGWQFTDNNSTQTAFNTPNIVFANIPLWNNLRGGTIIMIHHRSISSTGIPYPVKQTKDHGFIEVSANDVNFFSGGSFGTAPLYQGNSLNIATPGDLLQLLNASGTFVHALGHKSGTPGSSWNTLPSPKLDHQSSLNDLEAVFVCPGTDINYYGTLTPQVGTNIYTATGTNITPGLPNTSPAFPTENSNFWRSIRQPDWPSPGLTCTPVSGNTQITLGWTAQTDPNPSDGFQGYMILRSTNTFGTPVDGTTYLEGETIGAATVIKIINSSQTTSYTDTYPVPCAGGINYRVYAFRYTTDANGNSFNVARGRAYNESVGHYGEANVTASSTAISVSISVDQNPVCTGTSVTFTATPPTGTGPFTYQWKVNGVNSGTNNSTYSYIPVDADVVSLVVSSTDPCTTPGTSNSITMDVSGTVAVGVSITASANPVCTGTPVTFTALPINPGTAPVYQWQVNGINVGSNSDMYTYIPTNGDAVKVVLTSNSSCASANPATSNIITMIVGATQTPSVTIEAESNPVCEGMNIVFHADPDLEGTNPTFQWKVNGTNAGTNSPDFSYLPSTGDIVLVEMTSSDPCASGPPVQSNPVVVSVLSQIQDSVNITVFPGNIFCSITPVTFTAHPYFGGDTPQFQWYRNGSAVGTNSDTYSFTPADNDKVCCKLTSSLSCAGPPSMSDTIVMMDTTSVTVSVSITADPGVIFCDATPVTFTAKPDNGGANPTYQWHLNGAIVGTNDSTYTMIPDDGDKIFCIVTSSLLCADTPGKSDTLTMVYSSSNPVGVIVTASPGNSVCTGTSVTFTAQPSFGGTNPAYLWKVNGSAAGSISNTFSYVPADGDSITCILVSNSPCVTGNPATSVPVVMTVAPALPLSAVLGSNPSGSICEGTGVTFSAQQQHGGIPAFQWYINGSPAGTDSSQMTIIPSDGDKIWCRVSSSLSCVSPGSVMTDTITADVSSTLTPILTITADHLSMCPEMNIIFTADYQDAGSSPPLEWMIDGVVVQTDTSTVYSTTTLQSSQKVSCRLICNLPCATSNEAISSEMSIPQSDDCYPLFIPNAFTPDGDGRNDLFRMITKSESIGKFSMYIYDRWGQEIFRSEDILTGWDGKVNGQPATSGVYSWKIVYEELISGDTKVLSGTISLVK